jgi:hypothetical protein
LDIGQKEQGEQGENRKPPIKPENKRSPTRGQPLRQGFNRLEDINIEQQGYKDDDQQKLPTTHETQVYFIFGPADRQAGRPADGRLPEQNCGKLP